MQRRSGCFGGFGVIIVAIAIMLFIRFVIPALFWTFLIIMGLLVIGVIVLIVILANKAGNLKSKNKEGSGEKEPTPAAQTKKTAQLTPEQSAIITKGRSDLYSARLVIMRILNPEIKQTGSEINSSLDRLIQTLREKPNKIKGCRQFLNYYIPTLTDVLTTYQRLEESHAATIANTEKLKSFLLDFKRACEKQYQSLFADDQLDMTVDIEAMTIAIKRDGLMDDDLKQVPPSETSCQ